MAGTPGGDFVGWLSRYGRTRGISASSHHSRGRPGFATRTWLVSRLPCNGKPTASSTHESSAACMAMRTSRAAITCAARGALNDVRNCTDCARGLGAWPYEQVGFRDEGVPGGPGPSTSAKEVSVGKVEGESLEIHALCFENEGRTRKGPRHQRPCRMGPRRLPPEVMPPGKV